MSFDLQIISGDLVVKNGELSQVSDTSKLAQDVLKICITPMGGNLMYPWYGSLLSKTLIGSPLTDDIILQVGRIQLQNSIENLKSLQELQARSPQNVSPFEQISAIMGVTINRNANDLRLFLINVKVLSKGFVPIDNVFTVNTI